MAMMQRKEYSGDEVEYVFFVETANKFRKYISIIDDMFTLNPTMNDATRFTLFKQGFKELEKLSLKDGQKLGYVKVITTYEYREVIK